jgi:hypothetical protein
VRQKNVNTAVAKYTGGLGLLTIEIRSRTPAVRSIKIRLVKPT